MEEALEILRDQFVINRDDLRKKYPLGYALFYIDRKEIFAPYDVPESKNIQISFDKTKLLAFSKDRILIGDFFIADLKNHIILSDLSLILPREIGRKIVYVEFNGIAVAAEVLVDKKDYVVCVMGFLNRKT